MRELRTDVPKKVRDKLTLPYGKRAAFLEAAGITREQYIVAKRGKALPSVIQKIEKALKQKQ